MFFFQRPSIGKSIVKSAFSIVKKKPFFKYNIILYYIDVTRGLSGAFEAICEFWGALYNVYYIIVLTRGHIIIYI